MWRGRRRDGPTLAGWGLAAVVFGLVDWRAHDWWALHPGTQAAALVGLGGMFWWSFLRRSRR
jgi:hypothetical protein